MNYVQGMINKSQSEKHLENRLKPPAVLYPEELGIKPDSRHKESHKRILKPIPGEISYQNFGVEKYVDGGLGTKNIPPLYSKP